MAKVLSRPMFKRGGKVVAKNSGIVSGFADGGDVRQGFKNAGMVDLIDQYVQAPQQQRGLSRSDYLRIASAGAEIMGAPPTGRSGFIGALQAASPALSNLGTGLADDMATRDASYQDKLAKYDALKASAAMEDYKVDKEFGQQKDLLNKENELNKELLEVENKNKIEQIIKEAEVAPKDLVFYTNKFNEYVEEQSKYESGTDEWNKIQSKIDQLQTKYISPIAKSFGNNFQLATDAATYATTKIKELQEQRKLKGLPDLTAAEIVDLEPKYKGMYFNIIAQSTLSAIDPGSSYLELKAEGGRVGLALGGTAGPYEPGSGPDPDPGSPPVMTARGPYEPGSGPDPDPGSPPVMDGQPELTFQELRARLPRQVSDSVVRLLSTSEQALIEFAQIETANDISSFNQKYNTDLTLPAQV